MGWPLWHGLHPAARNWSFRQQPALHLVSKGAQATDLGDRLHYNAAVSYRFTGASVGHAGRMALGATEPLPEPMYHGGPKTAAFHREQPATPSIPSTWCWSSMASGTTIRLSPA